MKAPRGEGPSMPWSGCNTSVLAPETLENKLRGDVEIIIPTASVTVCQSIPL